ncbi:hypothetical protein M8C21_020305, partial [Ambrosia artemisiifolia]
VARRRQTKTNADLCNELREFVSEIGLPDGHVPSLKELSQHGRYTSQEIKVSDSDAEGSLTEDKANKEEDELTGPDESRKELTEYMLSPHEDIVENWKKLKARSEEPGSQVLCESDSANLDFENGSILTSQLIITQEDQAEINRIKVMLHNKELELSELKEQIEKNKQALSELQAKAEMEISKAQKLLLDKDAELLAAEESLSGLKQVQVEYWGEGETVQVAGSFNGWHHAVTLDPQPSSSITDPVELSNTRLWRSMLWLYPGIYEIKFIVDGKWMIDPMKEVVYRGSIQNNVLRVDR